MWKAIFLAVLTPGLLAAVDKPIEPKINKYGGSLQLDMGKTVQDAIRSYDPYFEAFGEIDFLPSVREDYKPTVQQTVSGVVGDFNGDKIKDVALFGRNRTNNLILAALSDGKGNYKIVEVDRSSLTDPKRDWIEGPKGKAPGLWRFLSHVKPGQLSSPYESRSLALKTDAFEEVYYKKGSVVYYYKDGHFERFTTRD